MLPQVKEIAHLIALQLPSREVSWMPIRNEIMTRIARRITLPAPKRVVVRPASLMKPKECESEKLKEMRIAVELDRERKVDERRRSMAAEHKTLTIEEAEGTHSEGEVKEDNSFTVVLKCS